MKKLDTSLLERPIEVNVLEKELALLKKRRAGILKKLLKCKSLVINGLYLDELEICGAEYESIEIKNSTITNGIYISDVRINNALSISESKVEAGSLCLTNSAIPYLSMKMTKIGHFFEINECHIGQFVIRNCIIEAYTSIKASQINDESYIVDTRINGSSAEEYRMFYGTEFKKTFSIINTKYAFPHSKEIAYRQARISHEKEGNKDDADLYYAYEMSAIRCQESIIMRCCEFPIDKVFKYGTSWMNVFVFWIGMMIAYSLVYFIGNGIIEGSSYLNSIFFSIAAATSLSYNDLHPSGIFKYIAASESIMGSFMWATSVAVFARKYMR